MALIVADRVLETSATIGAGALTLDGAVAGFRAFSAVCANADTAYYYIEEVSALGVPTGAWETGRGTWGTGNILTRTTVHASSNAGAAVVFAAGTKRVALAVTAASAVTKDGAETLTNKTISGASNTITGLSLTTAVTGVLPVANGGTNNAFFTVSGPAASAKTYTLPNASATVLTDNAAVTAAQGGTGQTTYAVGDVLYASTTSALSKLAGVATGNALISGGVSTAPAWGKVALTTHVSGILPAANGGTGVDNSTRTLTVNTNAGTLAFGAASKTVTFNNTLAFTGTDSTTMTFPAEACDVGFRHIPQITKVADGAPTTGADLTYAGKHIYHTSTAGTFTIPANASVAYPIGTALTFVNGNGAGNLTIAITTDTMRLSSAGTTGSRTLAANGVATAIKVLSTEWVISGSGLS